MHKKKKIIAVIDWYLPGYRAGGGQRAFANMVSYLRDTFDFYIITRDTDFLETTAYAGIDSGRWTERAEGEYVYYCPEAKIGRGLYKQLIEEVQPDYAYINGVYSPKFSILPLWVLKRCSFEGKKVLGTYGMLAPTAIQIKRRKKQLFLKASRLLGLYKEVTFHATSKQEVEDIRNALGKQVIIRLAPHLPVKELPELKMIEKNQGMLRLISIARISPEKNTLFALERLKELQVEGDLRYDLYGPIYDQSYWEKCRQIIAKLPSNIEVNHKGVVDGNAVLDLFSHYHALFMPTQGENFGYVILESFMAGRPVVISDQTPWRGLEEDRCGWDIALELRNGKVDELKAGVEKRIVSEVRSPKSGESAWCGVLSILVEMEQEEFDVLCQGARKRAVRFVNDPALKDGNVKLFE